MGNSSSTPAVPAPTNVEPPSPTVPVTPSQPSNLTPPPPVVAPEVKVPNDVKEETSTNPGTFEEMHRKCKG